MIIKTYTRDFLFIGLCNANDVQIKEQPNKEGSYSFSITDNSIMTNAYFCELIDQETNELKKMPNKVGVITSIDKDYKVSVASMERYLEKISNIPENWNWNLKNLSNVIKDHCYGFRQITYSSLSEIQSFVSSYHIQTAVVESGNGEVFADSAPFFSSENERYYYSDGYVIYRIQVPTNARRQGMVLRWKDTVGTTTDIGVQFAWSDSTTIPTTWSNEQSPVRGDSYTPNETDGIDIPESLLSYLYVKFNLKYDTGTISASYPKGVNYENEITTVTEPENNIVYYGKTAILYGFEVIYRVDTLISYGEIDVPNTKILDADITGKGNLLESLKALCEAYGYTFTITKTGNNFYLNVYQDYGTDLTNETFVSAKVNSLITRQDYKKELLEAVDAYGSGDGIDRIHTFVKIVDNPMNIGTFEDNDESDINTLVTKATNYINKENDELIAISFEFYERQFNISDKIRILCNDVVFTGKITEVSLNLKNSGWTKTYTVGIKSSALRTLFDPMFDGNYIPTVLAPRNVTANRVADGWVITWSSNYTNFILEHRKDENSSWQRKFINGNSVTIPYTEYLKIYEFRVYAIKDNIISSASNTIIFDSGKDTSVDSLIDGTADVDSPDKPIITKCIADKDGITINLQALADGLKNSIGKVIIEIKKADTWVTIISSNSLNNYYFFDRNSDGYPESSTINTWQVRCKIINSYQKESAYSSTSTVNTSNYGTWNVLPPDAIYAQSANRAANVAWQRKDKTPLGKEVYGISFFDIQISKDGTNWYKPAQGKTGKVSEDDWKDGTGYLRLSGSGWSQSLPLTGQTLGLPENTTYYYRIRTRGITDDYLSAWSDPVTAIALATGIGDIIEKSIKEAQLDDSSVTTDKLKAGAVTNVKIDDAAITTTKIVNDAIVEAKIAANAVTTNKISNAAIIGTKIADNAIEMAKFASGIRPPRVVATLPTSPFTGYVKGDTVVLTTDSKLYRFNGTAFTKAVDAVDIVANSITAAQIATGAISTDELAANAVTAAKIAANTITSSQIAANTITAGQIASSAITADEIATNAVTTEKINAGAVIADKIASNAVTTDKLLALAVTTAKLSAGAVTAEKVYAKAITTEKLDTNAVTTEKINAGAIIAEKIASNAVTTEKLHVLARNKINNFSVTGTLEGWTTGGEIVTVGSERALKLSSHGNPNFLSNPFDVQPDELLEFSFGLQCSREAEPNKGLYIGLKTDDTYEEFIYSWTDKKWNYKGVGTNAYFVLDYRSSAKRFFKTYILGYNIDITTVPSPQYTDELFSVRCLKLSSGKTQTRIRSGYNTIITPTFWYLFSPQVYQVGAGKIVAQQIDVKNLSAMSSKLGEIQGDTADYKLVMGSGGSAEEGTLLLGATTDESYLRRWKEGGIWKMALKLASFIVDAVSSKVLGQFEVKNSADTATHLTVDNTTGATIVSGGGDVSLSPGTGRLLIGNPAGVHMAIDENEIMAKSNGTTASTLHLNNDGGLVKCGGDLEVAGDTSCSNIDCDNLTVKKSNRTSQTFIIDFSRAARRIQLGRINTASGSSGTGEQGYIDVEVYDGRDFGLATSAGTRLITATRNGTFHATHMHYGSLSVTSERRIQFSIRNDGRNNFYLYIQIPAYVNTYLKINANNNGKATLIEQTPTGTEVYNSSGAGNMNISANAANADLLDGQHGSYYAPINNPIFTGTITGKANVRVSLRHGNTWFNKTWTGLTDSFGNKIWTDGENIYYSSGASQYVLNKTTSTWTAKTWTGLTNFNGNRIWTDGENIYCSAGASQYVLNKTTSTWTVKTWTGLTSFGGGQVWTDGENIYYSSGTNQHVLNKTTSTWTVKTWAGLTNFYGNYIWTDGENIYHSSGTDQYVLNKATSTWKAKTWTGLTSFGGGQVWTDGENIYYSSGTDQYVLNKTTSTWTAKTWTGLTDSFGYNVWTDGENIYYSSGASQYVLPATRHNYVDDTKYNSLFGTVTNCNLKTLSKEFVFNNE